MTSVTSHPSLFPVLTHARAQPSQADKQKRLSVPSCIINSERIAFFEIIRTV
jgi:hypothetical protein